MKDYTIYVTEEIAKKAIEKGFECRATTFFKKTPTEEQLEWIKDEDLFIKDINEEQPNVYKLPTAEQICGWLRNKKRIHINMLLDWDRETSSGYYCEIHYKDIFNRTTITQTYEESLLDGINKALDLI